ncbi:antiviral reverse transcriptase Drt3a [Rhodoferax sp.]|uniref:antiviral reverse transcriptase Drt3a n=1 Tax=Rhodoferax sp. TaxID=50421 RepID=UPI000AD3B172|nr:antiviral reverse transcriptase Drt3a [Rhodoferax sp.]
MYDQSFSKKTLARVIQKRDFNHVPVATRDAFREELLDKALVSALSNFNSPSPPLATFPLFNKSVYQLPKLEDELVARKLTQNLRRFASSSAEGRSQIVRNLALLLSEGVPYRVYRLDVRSFYESFQKSEVIRTLHQLRHLSPQSKSLIETLLNSHAAMGGSGVPRGLSLSAILSNLLMRDFDKTIHSNQETFYYSRYVDDIVIITSTREKAERFITQVKHSLPEGLELNPNKRQIVEAEGRVKPTKPTDPKVSLFEFEYLGYRFIVSEPIKQRNNVSAGDQHRNVIVDIGLSKVKKLKTRIVRSFLDFSRNGDWELLHDRIAFLTQNFSVHNPKAGDKKLAGIFHSYPLLTDAAAALHELDRFLRNAILSRTGRTFSSSATSLSASKRKQLLTYSFVRGHAHKVFAHFHSTRISEIQRCWVN